MIVGIDEVGRGCWAGPLCVGAVILSDETDRALLDDSKKLSSKKRSIAAAHIKRTALAIGIGWASAKYIDTYGLSRSLTYATEKAVSQINAPYTEIILDGTVNFLKDREVTLLPKADSLIPAVSAASLIAKVARDEYMQAIDSHFEGYGFAKHVGYGTKIHKDAIDRLGPTSLHRMSFSPLNQYVAPQPSVLQQTAGSFAESRAADYLISKGYTIVARNWKTKWCEIDIVAVKGTTVSFVEVKYRSNDTAGRGLEYVTTQKQQQMRFAAQLWMQQQKIDAPCVLSAIELSGEDFKVTSFVDVIV